MCCVIQYLSLTHGEPIVTPLSIETTFLYSKHLIYNCHLVRVQYVQIVSELSILIHFHINIS